MTLVGFPEISQVLISARCEVAAGGREKGDAAGVRTALAMRSLRMRILQPRACLVASLEPRLAD